jgi:hypothetical protein
MDGYMDRCGKTWFKGLLSAVIKKESTTLGNRIVKTKLKYFIKEPRVSFSNSLNL